MSLNDIKIKSLKPKDKPYKVFDGGGLYIYVTVKGTKKWRVKYYYNGKDSIYTIGDYPTVSLREARMRILEIKEMLSQGISPALEKKKNTPINGGTFKEVALDWADKQKGKWSDAHGQTICYKLERYIFGHIGTYQINEISAPQVLSFLRTLESKGSTSNAHKLLGIVSQVFRYGVACGL